MKPSFEGKAVWITGGGSGLGKAMALEFAREGAMVSVSGRRKDKLEATVREIEIEGGQGLVVPCDVSQEEQIIVAVSTIIKNFGRLDIAIANAAYSVTGSIEKLKAADWRRQFEVNVFGAAMIAKYTLPELRKTRGRLALVGSASSLATVPGFGVYASSKYALRALGQTLSIELHGSGVSCTLLYPGYMETEFAQIDNQGQFDPKKKKQNENLYSWSTEKSAKVSIRAIQKRKREYAFSALSKVWCWFGAHFPSALHFYLTRFGIPGGLEAEE
ncbi:MAG: SDR family NAD(P)-dependent oxidoreductase [Candidatus Latescibacteria bacterium]|jgi:NAD(P)-dependent dehydrogenase (short-subunit alcohol dehydrogenase family)|nr:SDR family NAD(P)-dependent oxidoreductase [Candidatus Latescibacterota bacterium]